MRPQTRSGRLPRLSRRSALGLGAATVAGVAVSGWARGRGAARVAGGAVPGGAVNTPLPEEHTRAARAVRALAPDVGVAVAAVPLVRGAEAAVRGPGQQHPPLASRLAGLLAM